LDLDHIPAMVGLYAPALGYRPLHAPITVLALCVCGVYCALGVGRILWMMVDSRSL